ncbi:rhodanese-like domain-containing protein [Pseudarthrobacter sp. AG30]|uniref:rhodanese-like domain-containing protein n=1 Tax=Pseudarthrobacter sp. AG30 TaxID=2249742 RepID=UPI000D6E0598|nr:rhodanese-like domain-containing protein [Pseudarthrobacter sp. AG30]RAX15064.1 rhodanese-like domain-containing protein [Pseudarthrobacter sp. AG30]
MAGQHAFRTVTAEELANVWPRAALVDVRSRDEHATAHVPGSLNIPLDELPSRLADLPNTTIHLLCGSGKRSSQAARILTDRGYTTVNVAGGITEWYRAGHPVTYQQSTRRPASSGQEPCSHRPPAPVPKAVPQENNLGRSALARYPPGYLY